MTRWCSARRSLTVTALAFAVGAAGCTRVYEDDGSTSGTTTSVPPPIVGKVGTPVTFGGVSATVVAISKFDQSPSGTPRIKVTMRSENLIASDRHNPRLRLACDETSREGLWSVGSTWESEGLLSVNTILQGEAILSFPAKAANPNYPVAKCTNATLRMVLKDRSIGAEQLATFPVNAETITESIQAERGLKLPLPTSSS